jgi:hypothetical protein
MNSLHQPRSPRTGHRRGISFTKPISLAKQKVPILDLADLVCGPGQMRRVGDEWVARCPLPGHEDKVPSFNVNPEKGVFHCFGCLRSGDVVDLARLCWHYPEDQMHIAAAMVLMEFGYEPTPRPPTWFDKQRRQRPVRDLIEETRVEVLTLRLWSVRFEPLLQDIENAEQRLQVAERLWPKVVAKVRSMIAERRSEAGSAS